MIRMMLKPGLAFGRVEQIDSNERCPPVVMKMSALSDFICIVAKFDGGL